MIFIVGLAILSYPFLSDFYYRIESNNVVEYFDAEKMKLSDKEIEARLDLARAYNHSLNNTISEDPYDEDRLKQGRAEYARMLQIREYIGHVEIPSIHQDIPIYAGTTEEVLQKGVGHLEGTSLPIGGQSTHTVLTAHTGLPEKKLFTDLDKVKKGDVFLIHNLKEILAYEVDQIKVVEPSNFSDLLVVAEQDYATLLTCTPYMVNTHRLLVRGHRIPYHAEEVDKGRKKTFWQEYFYHLLCLFILCILLGLYLWYRKRKKRRVLDGAY